MTRNNILIIFLLSFLAARNHAQYRDAGLWAEFSCSTELNKKWQIGLAPEIRLNENISELSRAFADFSIQHKVTKQITATATYRGGAARNDEFYEFRQRLQFGVGIKEKFGDYVIGFQSRWQLGLRSLTPENDADFVTTLRNKAQFKYTGLKGIDLATTFEIFNNSSQYGNFQLQNWRWTCGIEKKINKRNYLTLGYLIQKDLLESPQELDYVILLSYQYEFNFKKKEEKAAPEEIKEP